MNEEELSSLIYELLHILRDNKAIDTKQFNELWRIYKLTEL